MRAAMVIEPLAPRHIRDGFTCANAALDTYITRVVSQDTRRHLANVFVLTHAGSPAVIGYYSLSAYAVLLDDLPAESQRRLGRYPLVPATLLGRLAMSSEYQGNHLGEYLLLDALNRAADATAHIASAAVIVDAIDEAARAFYERYGFRGFVDNATKLFLPMQTIKALSCG